MADQNADKPVRILHVFGKIGLGGAESRMMDLYRHMDRSRVQFDFLVHSDKLPEAYGQGGPTSDELMRIRKPDYFDSEILSMGGRIFAVPRFHGSNIVQYRRALDAFFAEHAGEWNVVQGHMTSTASIYLPIAAKYGAKSIAPHVRSGGTDPGWKGIVTKLLRIPLRNPKFADISFACSHEAGLAVYGRKMMESHRAVVIPNAIDTSAFAYDESAREEIRRELGLQDAWIVGHVGRFHYAKNHEFLLRVFAELRKGMADAELILLGEGSLMEDMKALAAELGVADHVHFLGNHADVYRYYHAMDFLCFPSRYEGLPGIAIEAQASGLTCLISDGLTHDVDVTDSLHRKALEDGPEAWAQEIEMLRATEGNVTKSAEGGNAVGMERAACSASNLEALQAAGFDVTAQAAQMTPFYESGKWV